MTKGAALLIVAAVCAGWGTGASARQAEELLRLTVPPSRLAPDCQLAPATGNWAKGNPMLTTDPKLMAVYFGFIYGDPQGDGAKDAAAGYIASYRLEQGSGTVLVHALRFKDPIEQRPAQPDMPLAIGGRRFAGRVAVLYTANGADSPQRSRCVEAVSAHIEGLIFK